MVMTQQEVMGRSLDRAAITDTFEDESVKVGKKTCTCEFVFVVNNGKVKKATGACDRKCSGAVKKMSLNTDTCELSDDGAQDAFWGGKPDSSCESDAASNQECFAFATNYKHITTPIMVVQTLTDPTVKHECSPEVTEDPDYWVTYRNKVAALAEQFKQDK